jgi:hypothetical protein
MPNHWLSPRTPSNEKTVHYGSPRRRLHTVWVAHLVFRLLALLGLEVSLTWFVSTGPLVNDRYTRRFKKSSQCWASTWYASTLSILWAAAGHRPYFPEDMLLRKGLQASPAPASRDTTSHAFPLVGNRFALIRRCHLSIAHVPCSYRHNPQIYIVPMRTAVRPCFLLQPIVSTSADKKDAWDTRCSFWKREINKLDLWNRSSRSSV